MNRYLKVLITVVLSTICITSYAAAPETTPSTAAQTQPKPQSAEPSLRELAKTNQFESFCSKHMLTGMLNSYAQEQKNQTGQVTPMPEPMKETMTKMANDICSCAAAQFNVAANNKDLDEKALSEKTRSFISTCSVEAVKKYQPILKEQVQKQQKSSNSQRDVE